MQTLNPHKTGLILGAFLGIMHIVWSLLVLLGWAQPLADFSARMHMITPILRIESFDIVRAVGLVLIASLIGYIVGTVFAHLWNNLQKK